MIVTSNIVYHIFGSNFLISSFCSLDFKVHICQSSFHLNTSGVMMTSTWDTFQLFFISFRSLSAKISYSQSFHDQIAANHIHGQILAHCLYLKFLLEHNHARSFTYCLQLLLYHKGRIWYVRICQNLKIFITCFFLEEVCRPLLYPIIVPYFSS